MSRKTWIRDHKGIVVAKKMSRKVSRRVVRPACIAGVRISRPNFRAPCDRTKWCLSYLLLVMCTYPFAKKALTLHLARGEGRERYLGCNLMQRKVLVSSHQYLMAEVPADSKGV